MTREELEEIEDKAYEAGYQDGYSGKPQFSSWGKAGPSKRFYMEGYMDGVRIREREKSKAPAH